MKSGKPKSGKKPASGGGASARGVKAAAGAKGAVKAAVLKGARKAPVKSGIKSGGKSGVKSAVKAPLKSAVKAAVKAASKSPSKSPSKVVSSRSVSSKGIKRVKGAKGLGVVRPPLQPVLPPPPREPVRRQVSTGGLKAFEQALKVFNRRQFAEAKEMFEALQHRFPHEVEINARAQTYIQICNQKMPRPSASPRDAEELYDRGVIALNIGDFTQARSLFEKALRLRPNEPHLLYSLAATHAQTGARDEALDYLHRSIQIQPRYRAQAMNDADFSELYEDKRFLEILGVSSPFDLLEARR